MSQKKSNNSILANCTKISDDNTELKIIMSIFFFPFNLRKLETNFLSPTAPSHVSPNLMFQMGINNMKDNTKIWI
jgi:hypothetical protein